MRISLTRESLSCHREHARCRENLGERRTDSSLDNSKAEPGWSASRYGGGGGASNFTWDEKRNHASSHKGLKPPAGSCLLDPSIPDPPARALDQHPPGAHMPSSNPSRGQRQDPKAEKKSSVQVPFRRLREKLSILYCDSQVLDWFQRLDFV